MTDVARLAGVNRVTASVALNGTTNARTQVSEETRQRIFEAAQTLGYVPNRLALALRAQRTNIIGLYTGSAVLNTHGYFGGALLNGIQRGCRSHRRDVLLFSSFDPDAANALDTLLNGNIDGLIALMQAQNPIIDKIAESYLPLIVIASPHPKVPSVVVEEGVGGRLIADYLSARGHRHVLFCGDSMGNPVALRRQRGFIMAADDRGIRVDLAVSEWKGSLRPEDVALYLWRDPDPPTAVVCWSDSYAHRLIEQLRAHKMRVPQDVAVVAFETDLHEAHHTEMLTVVRAPWQHVAETAVNLLMALMEGQDVAQQTVFPVELVVGSTV